MLPGYSAIDEWIDSYSQYLLTDFLLAAFLEGLPCRYRHFFTLAGLALDLSAHKTHFLLMVEYDIVVLWDVVGVDL